MSKSSKPLGKSGWWSILAAMALLLAPFFAVIPAEHAARLNALKAEGFVTQATITGKEKKLNYYTDSKGRKKSTTDTIVNFEYDMMANQPYADWVSGGEKVPAALPTPITTTYGIIGSNAEYDAAVTGAKEIVVIHPNERNRAERASKVKTYSPLPYYLLAFGFAIVSVFAGVMAWRTRVKAQVVLLDA
jgi:ribosomal protein S8